GQKRLKGREGRSFLTTLVFALARVGLAVENSSPEVRNLREPPAEVVAQEVVLVSLLPGVIVEVARRGCFGRHQLFSSRLGISRGGRTPNAAVHRLPTRPPAAA